MRIAGFIFVALSALCTSSTCVAAEPDTSAIDIYLEYGWGDILDTFHGIIQKDLVLDGTIGAKCTLTDAERDTILKRAIEIGFFSLPDTIPQHPSLGEEPNPSPETLRIKYGDVDHTVVWHWHDPLKRIQEMW